MYYISWNFSVLILITFNKDKPIKPQELLLMVLPIESSNYLCKSYKDLLIGDNKCNIALKPYFPKEYNIRMFFHSYTWECHPIIPSIDYEIIKNITRNCKLTLEEQKRNKIGNVIVIEP